MSKLSALLSLPSKSLPVETFLPRAVKAVEGSLVEKNGKPYITCAVRHKDVLAKPEEVVRQLWIQTLLKQYHYPIERLAVEYPVTFGRDTSKRADIVVFDADRPTVPYLIVEVKQITSKGAIPEKEQNAFETIALRAAAFKQEARDLLARAQRTVEIAIEEGEAAGMAVLAGGAHG